MSKSFREINYSGSISYQQGQKSESLRIAHAVFDGKGYERLEYLDGKPRQIIRHGNNLKCVQPGLQLIRRGSEPNLGEHYEISTLGSDRVAGRNVIKLKLTPIDQHRLIHVLSLDELTGLLLKSELMNDKNDILERFQFVDIAINADIPMSHFNIEPDTYQAIKLKPHEVRGNDNQWEVTWMPTGFKSAVGDCLQSSADMETFTDGFAVFSVFLESVETLASAAEAQTQLGATCAYSRPLMLAGQPHRVTVVGEIPRKTAKKIAQSVSMTGGQ